MLQDKYNHCRDTTKEHLQSRAMAAKSRGSEATPALVAWDKGTVEFENDRQALRNEMRGKKQKKGELAL